MIAAGPPPPATGAAPLPLLAAPALHLRALALDLSESPVRSRRYHLALLAGHLAGLLAVARLAHWPLWAAPLALAVLALPQALRRRWFAESLAPLALVYGLAALRLIIVYALRQTPDTRLSYAVALALSALWVSLIALRSAGWLAEAVVGAAAVGAAGLLFAQLWRLAPAGVTGSDPFAYVQMAIDLAERGTPRHAFPLVPLALRLGLPPLPATHVGYIHPNASGLAPTVWPAGYSALLAGAYRLGGERALLTFNAWVALASLALTMALGALLAPAAWRRGALLAGLGAVVVQATAPRQFVALAVPMADGAVQALTTLAVVLILLALRPGGPAARPWLLGALAGLALAAAYSARYTQLLLGPGLVAAGWLALRDGRQRRAFVVALALAALVGALPDVVFRTRAFGAPWRVGGSGELESFALGALPEALGRVGGELLRPEEFGWLWLAALAGAVYAWRHSRRPLGVLAAAYLPVVVFHLWYPFLRLRDLLFLYAPLAALAALGGAAGVRWLWRRGVAGRLAAILGLLAVGVLRAQPLLAFQPGFYTFGGLQPAQRAALESLASLTEPEAVVACSLNSGPVELYGRRLAVRPGQVLQPRTSWTTDQWLVFVEALRAEGRPLYVLVDSPELEAPLAALRARYRVERVADLEVPVFYFGGGSSNQRVPLYRVQYERAAAPAVARTPPPEPRVMGPKG